MYITHTHTHTHTHTLTHSLTLSHTHTTHTTHTHTTRRVLAKRAIYRRSTEEEIGGEDLGMSNETYFHVKSDLFVCQKRPICARGDRWGGPGHKFSKSTPCNGFFCVCVCGGGCLAPWHRFSKVLCIVALHGK